MKKITKFNLRTLLVLILSLALCFSTLLSVACDKPDNSSSSSGKDIVDIPDPVYPTDGQSVTNGNFEFSTFDNKVSAFPDSSSIGWSPNYDSIAGVNADGSSKYGIIDVDVSSDAAKTNYNDIAKNSKLVYGEESYNPGTPYDFGFVNLGTEDEEGDIVGVVPAEGDTAVEIKNTKILMINNYEEKGSARKFTSTSSLSLGRNEYAELSVWVKTNGLAAPNAATNSNEFGAYIAVQNTLSNAAAPFIIKNINTNGNWAKYTIYLESSDFTTSSFKVVLGLGFGSKAYKTEYVSGAAFFDNVSFKTISLSDYNDVINGNTEKGIEKLADANKFSVYEGYELKEDSIIASQAGLAITANTKEGENANKSFTNTVYSLSHKKAEAVDASQAYDFVPENKDDVNVTDNNELTENVGDITTPLANTLGDNSNPALKGTDNVLYINHTNPTSTSVRSNVFTLGAGEYRQITFWVKVHTERKTDTGLTITVKDLGTGNDVEDCTDTVVASNVTTDEYENEDYGNWRQYVVYLSNTADETNARNFVVNFDFGTTAESISNGEFDLTQGYAIISEFETFKLTKEEYGIADATKYTYVKKVALSHDLSNTSTTEDEEESYYFNYNDNDKVVIANNGVATNVLNYTGVVGGSKFVGGTNDTTYSANGVKAGIVKLDATTVDFGAIGENKFVQPLMIERAADATSFGYVGKASKVAAGSASLITVKVHVTGEATAYIYLTGTDPLAGFKVLTLDATGKVVDTNSNELVDSTEAKVSELVIKVTKANIKNADDTFTNYTKDGWLTVQFLIIAGNEDISFRPELWNGARDGKANGGAGTVYFDEYSVSTTTIKDLQEEIKANYGANETATITSYTQHVTFKYSDNVKDNKYSTKNYNVFYVYDACKTIIADYSPIHAETVIDKTPVDDKEDTEVEDSTTSEESTSETNSFSAGLQITSIIVAAVLVAALIAVLIRLLVKKYRKNKGASVSYYNRDSRERAGLAIEAKKAKLAAEKKSNTVEVPEEEVVPYDYDNMENNVVEENPEESAEESVEETPVEETPVEAAPVEEAPVEAAPVEEAPVEAAPVEEAPAVEAPAETEDKGENN